MQKLKEYSIMIGIIVIFSALIIVAVDAFYSEPTEDQFCKEDLRMTKYPVGPEPTTCNYNAAEGPAQACYNNNQVAKFDYNETGCRIFTGCSDCRNRYEDAQQKHAWIAFAIIALIGAFAIVGGLFYPVEFIGTGFIASGVFLIFWATVRYFGEFHKFVRVGVLLFDLIVVLWIAKKKVADKKD